MEGFTLVLHERVSHRLNLLLNVALYMLIGDVIYNRYWNKNKPQRFEPKTGNQRHQKVTI